MTQPIFTPEPSENAQGYWRQYAVVDAKEFYVLLMRNQTEVFRFEMSKFRPNPTDMYDALYNDLGELRDKFIDAPGRYNDFTEMDEYLKEIVWENAPLDGEKLEAYVEGMRELC